MQNDGRSFDVVRPSTTPQAVPYAPAPVQASPVFTSPKPQPTYRVPTPYVPQVPPPQNVQHTPRRFLGMRLPWVIGISAALGLLIIGGIVAYIFRAVPSERLQATDFNPLSIPLGNVTGSAFTAQAAKSLKVNGQLKVADSLILSPTTQPQNAVAGQLYYDQAINLLAFYNGQQFIPLGSTTAAGATNITNVLGGTGSNVPGVQLQATTPGIQQAGNFNIAGIGQVGTLKTTTITSDSGTLYINPISVTAQQQITAGTPVTVGLTNGSTNAPGPGWANDLSATKVTTGGVGGTASSITVTITSGTGTGHVQVGLYDDDGNVPSRPGNLLAQSVVSTLHANGSTTVTIPGITLAANTNYWIGFNTDDNTIGRTYNPGSKATCFKSSGFGFMPDPFGGCFFDNNAYSVALNYIAGGGVSGGASQAQFVLGPTGQAVFQNSADSNTAFQVQNAAGNSTIFNVDTINGRVGIGKITPAYKLDIAGGDINLSNGHSIRFGGVQALATNSDGSTVSITNFLSTGTVSAQADNFVIQDANATMLLFKVDVANLKITIGNPAGDNTPVVLYLANKNTAGDPSGAEGATYYNSTLGSFRCFYSGFWHNCADAEPQHSFTQNDEFLGGQASFTGQIGSLGWTPAAIGANGSLAVNPGTPPTSADRPGVLRIRTPAVANQGTTLLLGDGTTGSVLIAKDNDLKTAVAVGATTSQVLRVGLHNESSTTTQPVSGVWWEANPAVSANWRYCYGNGTTATCTATSAAIAANTWVTLEVRVTATGAGTSAATFVIDNTPFSVSAVTIDTTNSVSPAYSCYATAASARDCFWDYFQLTGTTAVRR